MMNNHQSLKAEIDAREDNFSACFRLGKELLARNHYASNEVNTCDDVKQLYSRAKMLFVVFSLINMGGILFYRSKKEL